MSHFGPSAISVWVNPAWVRCVEPPTGAKYGSQEKGVAAVIVHFPISLWFDFPCERGGSTAPSLHISTSIHISIYFTNYLYPCSKVFKSKTPCSSSRRLCCTLRVETHHGRVVHPRYYQRPWEREDRGIRDRWRTAPENRHFRCQPQLS